jgi:hypothetical protein
MKLFGGVLVSNPVEVTPTVTSVGPPSDFTGGGPLPLAPSPLFSVYHDVG